MLQRFGYKSLFMINFAPHLTDGELAQLARALAWHARGHRFEPGILHFFLSFQESTH